MRDAQSLLFDHPLPIQNQIEVQGARRARGGTFASELALHLEQRLEQFARRQGRLPHRGGVEETRLVAHAYSGGVVKGRDEKIVNRGLQRLDGVEEVALAVAKIAAERDRDRDQRYSIQRVESTAP